MEGRSRGNLGRPRSKGMSPAQLPWAGFSPPGEKHPSAAQAGTGQSLGQSQPRNRAKCQGLALGEALGTRHPILTLSLAGARRARPPNCCPGARSTPTICGRLGTRQLEPTGAGAARCCHANSVSMAMGTQWATTRRGQDAQRKVMQCLPKAPARGQEPAASASPWCCLGNQSKTHPEGWLIVTGQVKR